MKARKRSSAAQQGNNMKKEEMPHWDSIENEVVRKLHFLRAAWEHSATKGPEFHERMKRELFLPVIRYLGGFCVLIQEDQDRESFKILKIADLRDEAIHEQ
jgi:hypothetical protein